MSDSEGRRGRFTPLKRLSDDELAIEASRGDDKAFALLFERLQDPLYRYCMSILGNPEEARDALQNAMLKAHRALRGETREIAVRPWLYRIARNESVTALRGRRPLGELEEAVGVAAAGADVEAASRERLSDLVSDLRSLPERQRSALVLRELSGLDYEELGAALDISPNAARQTVFKARVSMQSDVEGRTAHCDEVRAAMSKNDGRFRRRRSIQAHLERCPVCTEFASGLESRPRDLAALFPPLPAGVAAAVLATATGEAADDEAATGAMATGAGAGGVAAIGAAADDAEAGGAEGVGTPASERARATAAAARTRSPITAATPTDGGRRRGLALVPLLLFLLLIGGTIATALILESGEDGGGSDVAQDNGPAGSGDGGESGAGSKDSDTDSSGSRDSDAEGSGNGGGSGSGSDGSGSKDSETGSSGSRDSDADGSGSGSRDSDADGSGSRSRGSDAEGSGSGSGEPGSGSGGGGSGNGSGSGSSREGRPEQDCVKRTRAGTSPAQEAYSGRGGRIEVEVTDDCPPTRRANDCEGRDRAGSGSGARDCARVTRSGVPITGLELGLVVGCAFLLLGLGVSLRRLATS